MRKLLVIVLAACSSNSGKSPDAALLDGEGTD